MNIINKKISSIQRELVNSSRFFFFCAKKKDGTSCCFIWRPEKEIFEYHLSTGHIPDEYIPLNEAPDDIKRLFLNSFLLNLVEKLKADIRHMKHLINLEDY